MRCLYTVAAVVALVGVSSAGTRAGSVPGAEEVARVSRLQGSAFLGRNRQVVGATVTVTRADEASRLFVTASDVRGTFRVDGLPDGTYRLEVRREGLDTVVKEDIGLRFPTRAVIEVLMQPSATPSEPSVRASGSVERGRREVELRGELVSRDGEPIAGVPLRFVRPDGVADPVVTRTSDDGSFVLPPVPVGEWRLETRVVGFLPIWARLDLRDDTRLTVSLVEQPAGYDPSPLELMPSEQPVPPRTVLVPPPSESVLASENEEAGD